MVWAGIHYDGHTPLVRGNEALSALIYLNMILQYHIVPLIKSAGGIF